MLSRSGKPALARPASPPCCWLWAAAAAAVTSYKQPGFSETVVFSGLTNPTVVRFLPDGRVLVAEKSGLIKLFPNLTTNTYTVVADLRTEVHNFWDRGLLGLAIDPNFATNNYIYVLYSYDATIGGTPPRWGVAGQYVRRLPDAARRHDRRLRDQRPPRAPDGGRPGLDGQRDAADRTTGASSSRATRPARSISAPDGYLYVSGGDGASFNNADWGQFGGGVGSPTPANPCGDPPFPSARRRPSPPPRAARCAARVPAARPARRDC